MHSSMRPKLSNLVAGDRFVAFNGGASIWKVLVVEEVDADGNIRARASDDSYERYDQHGAIDLRRADGSTLTAFWTLPLPDADIAAQIAYSQAYRHTDQPYPRWTAYPPLLLYVTAVQAGFAACRPIVTAGNMTVMLSETLQMRDTVEMRPGDLVVSARAYGSMDDMGQVFVITQHGFVAREVTLKNLETWLPSRRGTILKHASAQAVEHLKRCADASSEPDECVVLYLEKPDDQETHGVVLSCMGLELAVTNRGDIDRNFQTNEMPRGLSIFENVYFQASFDFEGNALYSCNGDFRPASRADLERHKITDNDVGLAVQKNGLASINKDDFELVERLIADAAARQSDIESMKVAPR